MSDKALSFEEALARLDSIVRQLEKGDAPLDQALALFEEGTNLIGRCTKMLDEAEQKVVQLKKGPDGEPVEVPFDSEE
jgi:exodeoxyribonuclease VII small subunit